MKAIFATLKTGDIIIAIILLLLSLSPFAVFAWQQSDVSGEELIAVISLENEVIHEINLSEYQGSETFEVHAHDHETNTIEISDGQIRVKSATCSDQVCVRRNYIQRAGQTIVCLPHQLVIEIQNIGDDQINDHDIDIIALN